MLIRVDERSSVPLYAQIAGQIKDFDHRQRLKHWQRDKTILFSDRFSWLAAAAADEAMREHPITRIRDNLPT